jgi:monoterpene epsilon-lactone hydrolase
MGSGPGNRDRAPSADLTDRRETLERLLAARPLAPGVTVEITTRGDVPVEILTPSGPRREMTAIHFHGGGLRVGSAREFRFFTSYLAKSMACAVISVDYSLAPEYPYPAALGDAISVYQAVVTSMERPGVVLLGESAGANLAAALMLSTRALGLPAPAAGILLSPWVDLRVVASSYRLNAGTDKAFSEPSATEASAMYRNGHPATDPGVSPLLGSWRGQPPILIQASDAEVLWGDATALAETALRDGVDVTLSRYAGQPHVWHYEMDASGRARDAMSEISTFLDRVVGGL